MEMRMKLGSVSETLLMLNSLNDSAQSPPINKNPSPSIAAANFCCRFLTSPANIRGAFDLN